MAKSKVAAAVMAGGFLAAHERLQGAIHAGRPPEEVFRPLFEVLNWVVSLDEDFGLSTTADLSQEARGVLTGLRWARNLTHHHWGMALVLKDAVYPIAIVQPHRPGVRGPNVVKVWHWCSAKKLPRPTNRL